MARKKYFGPHYQKGILIAGITYDPRKMNAAERTAFLEKYPARITWWEKPPETQKPAEEEE